MFSELGKLQDSVDSTCHLLASAGNSVHKLESSYDVMIQELCEQQILRLEARVNGGIEELVLGTLKHAFTPLA